MKFLLAFISAACCAQPTLTPVPSHLPDSGDYGMGREFGRCIVAKCQVFRGHLVTESPKSGESLTIQVDERLFGVAPGTETIKVPYSTEILRKAPTESPGYAWKGVSLAPDAPLTVILAVQRVGAVQAGSPVFVTSDEHKTEVVRSLSEKAVQLEHSPALISDLVASLPRETNLALAGYLFILTGHVALRNPELASSLFETMIGSPGVPPETWGEIAGFMVLDYYRLSESGKGAVVKRFTDLAQQSDSSAVRAGFRGLNKIASFDHSVSARIPPASLGGLVNAYRDLVKSGSLARNAPLETELGIKFE